MKISIIGPLCKDCNIVKGKEFYQPGGVTYYAGQALSSLDIDTTVFASYDDSESHWIKGIKFHLIPISKNSTIQFTNKYLNKDANARVQFAEFADVFDNIITLEDIPLKQLSKTDYIILGPLFHNNFSDTLIEKLSKNNKLILAAQGIIRYLDNKNHIVWKNPLKILKLLPFVEYLFLDDKELEFITKCQNLRDGASYLQSKGVKNVIVTLESRGSRLFLKNKEYSIKAYPPNTLVNPTGAGDTYIAGFIKALELFDDPIKQGEFAAMTSTICIENQGPFTGTLDEVLKRLKQSD